MSLWSDVVERARALVLRGRMERELDEELQFHVERETAERIRNGAEPAVARREALLALGGVERTKEDVRDARGVRPLADLAGDLRHALRALRRNPVFTAAAVLVLGLGLGASTTVFAVMDAVLLSPLPYPHPDRLVMLVEQNSPTNIWALSTADAVAIAEGQHSFDAFGVVQRGEAALSGSGQPARVTVGRASAGFFAALGVTAAEGRLVEPADGAAGAPAVVVVSHALAERTPGGVGAAVGHALTIDGLSHTVVGVLPAGVTTLAGVRADAWPAVQLAAPVRRGPFWLRGVARLKDGVTLDAAARDLAGVSRRLLEAWTADWRDTTARITPYPLRDVLVRRAGGQVRLFAVAVALVLLVAIANVATLLLVRASAREAELTVRAALGAGRLRLARLLIVECLTIVGLGAAVGAGLAVFGLRLAVALAPTMPRIEEAVFDARAVGFLVAAALLSGVLVSISPVSAGVARRMASRRADARRSGTGRRTAAVRSALVTAEFALALPLLLGAGLMLRSFLLLARVDPGFDPAGVVSVNVSLPRARYPDYPSQQAFWRQVEQRGAVVPGFATVGLSSSLPPDNGGNTNNFALPDHPVAPGGSEPVSPWSAVTAGFFPALGVPLLAGRLFTEGDSGTAPPVVVVSRSWADHYFPRETVVGRELISGGCYDCPRTTIVGVVGDVKYAGLDGGGDAVYEPVTQSNGRGMYLVARTGLGSGAALRALRAVVGAIDPEMPLVETTLEQEIAASLADPRRLASVLGAFAIAGVLLAGLGVFGLMSYVVHQRRREIGVRIALGAEPARVAWMVVGRGMRYAALGSVLGLGFAVIEMRWLRAFLFGIEPTDLPTLAAVAALLLGTALVACWLPSRRAARIHPVEALSGE